MRGASRAARSPRIQFRFIPFARPAGNLLAPDRLQRRRILRDYSEDAFLVENALVSGLGYTASSALE
jgi:hypothetical protein